MNRRLLRAATAAAALTFVPTAAFAYNEPGSPEFVVNVPGSVAQGVPFNITAEGPNENASFGLAIASQNVPNSAIEIAGSQALQKNTIDGDVTFSVTLHEEALYDVTVVDEDGEVVETLTLAVGMAAGGGPGSPSVGSVLPDTGAESTALAISAAGLLAVGAGALALARRRQSEA